VRSAAERLCRVAVLALSLALFPACGDGGTADDAGTTDGGVSGPIDGGTADAAGADGGGAGLDAATPGDAGVDPTLSALRDALFGGHTSTPCETWASYDESARAVFLTITHRLYLSRTPDGRRMLEHIDGLHLVRGGGSSGTSCGGAENNRLFLSMDASLWQLAVETWDGTNTIDDGSGGSWAHTSDIAGPHDPFHASIETRTGLDCVLLVETSDSRPPTAQAHFFLDGSAVPVERGPDISLPADPTMLEIDQDFDCLHDSNPTCRDFETRYRDNYGDFECEWVPSACAPEGAGCFRTVAL
jgi:hypothetical protein